MSLYIDLKAVSNPRFTWPHLLKHPTIPEPMFGFNPRTVLGQEWWDIQRKAAYVKNNLCCWACGKSAVEGDFPLEAHECYRINYRKGEMELKLIAALCHDCHAFIHSGRSGIVYSEGEYRRILERGHKILEGAPTRFPQELRFIQSSLRSLLVVSALPLLMAPPEKWHLIIDGKRYKP